MTVENRKCKLLSYSYRYRCCSKAEMALPIKLHTRNFERAVDDTVFYRIYRWLTRTGSSNNLASFSDNSVIPNLKSARYQKQTSKCRPITSLFCSPRISVTHFCVSEGNFGRSCTEASAFAVRRLSLLFLCFPYNR